MSLAGFVSRAGAQERPSEWTLVLGAQESNEFARTFDGVAQDDVILDNVNAMLELKTHSERSRVGIFGRAGYDFYRESEFEDRVTFGGGLTWNYEGERSESLVLFSIERNLTAQTLASLGVLAPGIETDTIDTRWTFNYQKSPRTTLFTELSYNHIQFDSRQSIPGSQIVLPQSPFRDRFPPFLDSPSGPTDPDVIDLPDPEEVLLEILATEGFSSPSSKSQWGTAIFGLSHQLSEYSTLGFDVGGGYRNIDTGVIDFREGSEGGFRVWTERRLGTPSSIGVSYELHRSIVQIPATTVQNLTTGFTYAHPQKELTLRATGGAGYFQAESLIDMFTPIMDASFTAGLTRSTTFVAAYQRQFAQALGFGRTLLIDFGTVSLTQEFGTKLTAVLLAGGSFGRDPVVEESRYDAVQAGGTLTYDIVESFQLGTSFFLVETEQSNIIATDIADTRRKIWTAFVTYRTSWR